jgi:hypothetical protein
MCPSATATVTANARPRASAESASTTWCCWPASSWETTGQTDGAKLVRQNAPSRVDPAEHHRRGVIQLTGLLKQRLGRAESQVVALDISGDGGLPSLNSSARVMRSNSWPLRRALMSMYGG